VRCAPGLLARDATRAHVYIMLRYGIAQFIGSWLSESGHRLHIVEKVRKDRAVVDFLDPRGAPIARPYMGRAPSMTRSSAKRLYQASADMSETVFWIRITHCLALWITLFEQRGGTRDCKAGCIFLT